MRVIPRSVYTSLLICETSSSQLIGQAESKQKQTAATGEQQA
jgi:hypothetical protein